MAKPEPDPAREKERRDAAFAAAEQARREAGWALTPAERLEWLEEALDLAWASGALQRRHALEGTVESAMEDGAEKARDR